MRSSPFQCAWSEPSAGTGSDGALSSPSEVDVTTIASDAIDRAGDVTTTPPTAPEPDDAAPANQSAIEPVQHQVMRGETAYSIARIYNVDVGAIAEWNGLDSDLAIREGQFLLIPVARSRESPEEPASPGQGSETPVPPSAADPLPEDAPQAVAEAQANDTDVAAEAPDMGSQQTQASQNDASMIAPVAGSIIREYAPGRNEGIDIGADAGTPVRAAADGTVAAITTDTSGIQIVVIRHLDNLLTVYTHIDDLRVERNQSVSQGTVIGAVMDGDPSFLHFEVRQGTESTDPTTYLP